MTPRSPEESASSPVRFDIVALDTPDPPGLAGFYCALLGWQVERADPDWVTITGGTGGIGGIGARIAFQLAPDFKPPTWPDNTVPQQIHFDFRVDDLAAGAAFAESVGARRMAQVVPEQEGFIVFLDPSGHPFCLCD